MDPVSPGVISGLVVEAVAGLARPLLARGREPHTANLAAPSAQALQLTVVHALTVRGFTHSEQVAVAQFLRSPLSRVLVRATLVAHITGTAQYGPDLAEQIEAALRYTTELSHGRLPAASTALHAIYAKACESYGGSTRRPRPRPTVAKQSQQLMQSEGRGS